MRNVIGHLPKELHDQARSVLRAAWKLDAKAGKARIEQFASWVETQHPGAAGSLREGLNELFTVSAIGLAPAVKRCLGTTNVIDNAHSGMRRRTGRVTRWKNGSMAVRWAAAAFLEAEKGYRRIMGYRDLWMLKAHLDELSTPRMRKRRTPLSMNRPRATSTSNYGWDSLESAGRGVDRDAGTVGRESGDFAPEGDRVPSMRRISARVGAKPCASTMSGIPRRRSPAIAFGAMASPKPSSRALAARSNSRTFHPACRKAMAADSPPMPASTIRAVRFIGRVHPGCGVSHQGTLSATPRGNKGREEFHAFGDRLCGGSFGQMKVSIPAWMETAPRRTSVRPFASVT